MCKIILNFNGEFLRTVVKALISTFSFVALIPLFLFYSNNIEPAMFGTLGVYLMSKVVDFVSREYIENIKHYLSILVFGIIFAPFCMVLTWNSGLYNEDKQPFLLILYILNLIVPLAYLACDFKMLSIAFNKYKTFLNEQNRAKQQ